MLGTPTAKACQVPPLPLLWGSPWPQMWYKAISIIKLKRGMYCMSKMKCCASSTDLINSHHTPVSNGQKLFGISLTTYCPSRSAWTKLGLQVLQWFRACSKWGFSSFPKALQQQQNLMPEQPMAWRSSGRCLKERVILKNTHLGLVLILLKWSQTSHLPSVGAMLYWHWRLLEILL